jgi:hypothetical protein
MTQDHRPHLRVVGDDVAPPPAVEDDNSDDLSDLWIDPGVGDPLAAPEVADRGAKKKAPPLPRSGSRLFAVVYLDQLTDRRWDRLWPPLVRLYCYLQIKSRRGARTVRLTNEMAAEIGIDRKYKSDRLKALEALRLIKVTRDGLKTPVVRMLKPKRPGP